MQISQPIFMLVFFVEKQVISGNYGRGEVFPFKVEMSPVIPLDIDIA